MRARVKTDRGRGHWQSLVWSGRSMHNTDPRPKLSQPQTCPTNQPRMGVEEKDQQSNAALSEPQSRFSNLETSRQISFGIKSALTLTFGIGMLVVIFI